MYLYLYTVEKTAKIAYYSILKKNFSEEDAV